MKNLKQTWLTRLSYLFVLLHLTFIAYSQQPYCEITSFDVTLSDGWKVSTSNPNGIIWGAGTKILIPENATVHFDRNVTMQQCTVKIGKNSKIIVESSAKLTTNTNTILFGCNSMWAGIQINFACSFDLTNTEIRDAVNGLILMPGNNSSVFLAASDCKISGCTFRNNYIGIKVHDDAPTDNVPLYFFPSVFSGNTFITHGGFLYTPKDQEKAIAALSFNNCLLGSVSGLNIFDRTGDGVKSEYSSIFINGGKYFRMKSWINNTNGFFSGGGRGVRAYKSAIQATNTELEDVDLGVITNYGKYIFNVQNCIVKQCEEGGIICINNPHAPTVSILDNILDFTTGPSYGGITVTRSVTSSFTTKLNEIRHNILTFKGVQTKNCNFIEITGQPNPSNDNFPIRTNTITIEPTSLLRTPYNAHGIYVTSGGPSSGYDISNNTLNYLCSTAPLGSVAVLAISMINVNGERNSIAGNHVTSLLFPNPTNGNEEASSWIKCGVHLDNSANVDICSNTFDNTYRAFHLSGSLNYCDVAFNTIGHHYYGLLCYKMPGSPNTNLGDQKWHENTWLTDPNQYKMYSARNQDFENGNAPFVFKVDPDSPSHMPPGGNLTPSKVKPLSWFIPQHPNPPFEVENTDCGGQSPYPRPPLDGWDNDIISGNYPYESPSQSWDMQRNLYYKMLQHPETHPTGSTAAQWYDNNVGNSTWKFAMFEKMFGDAYNLSPSQQSNLDIARSQYITWMREAARLDSLQSLDISSDDPAIRSQQINAISQWLAAQNSLKAQQQSVDSIVGIGLNNAEAWLNTFSTSQIWDANRKFMYSLWLKQARAQELLETDLAAVRIIANQCPLQGGLTVREMPSFLPFEESAPYKNEDYWADCANNRNEGPKSGSTPQSFSLTVAPNPAQDQITVFFQPSSLSAGSWQVFDLSGKAWLEGVSKGEASVTLTISTLPQGIYFYSIQKNDGTYHVAKFVITR